MRLVAIGFLIILLTSCTANEQKNKPTGSYFNLKGYFEKEADRLNKLHSQIAKSVEINGVAEQKQVKIENFKNELNSFITADINKASWRGSFKVKKQANTEIYTTENEKIPVKRVEIHYLNQQIEHIKIVSLTENILYHSSDTLNYFPDSLYELKKIQKIKFLKKKKYVIVGKFK